MSKHRMEKNARETAARARGTSWQAGCASLLLRALVYAGLLHHARQRSRCLTEHYREQHRYQEFGHGLFLPPEQLVRHNDPLIHRAALRPQAATSLTSVYVSAMKIGPLRVRVRGGFVPVPMCMRCPHGFRVLM